MNKALVIPMAILALASSAFAQLTIPVEQRVGAQVVSTLSAPGEAPMQMPTDVAVGRDGKVYVADGVNRRVVCFKSDHSFETEFTNAGNHALSRPLGLDVDHHGNLWITDGENRAVYWGTVGGTWKEIALPPKSEEQPFDATGVVVTNDGARTYVVDNDNHRIAIRDNATGRFTFAGGPGESLGQLRWPFLAEIGPSGDLFVTEAVGARVQRLSPDGKWGRSIGRWGVSVGQLYRPKGIAIDADGRLFVSDSTTGVVQVFSRTGAVVGVLCGSDSAPLAFDHPMGMCFDNAGRLLVVELASNRVAVVQLDRSKPENSNSKIGGSKPQP